MIGLTLLLVMSVQQTPSDEEIALNAVVECLFAQAAELDDGVSDATTVGRAVATACNSESSRYRATFALQYAPGLRSSIIEAAEAKAFEPATSVVLRARAAKRKAASLKSVN
ncbi:MAG: hypothetical protein EON58_01915 [Alphaproteobacteria bacterium]|nr:MAG: hypothetical protein EON58_01915 [Alphaproteobacteria bacterium]